MFTFGTAFADEIIDRVGNITPCKITSVSDGLIQYKINGSEFSLRREYNNPVFNDYVETISSIGKEIKTVRYTGKLVFKDHTMVTIRTNNEDVNIPWYRVKLIGLYNPY